jgi:hypothetical protein
MRTSRALVAIALGVLASGCQPHYDGLRIRYLNGTGNFSQGGLEIEEGQALAVQVEALSDNPYEDYEAFDIIEMRSFNEHIVLVAPADDIDRFVFVGAAVGTSAVEVIINGDEVDTITAIVSPPPRSCARRSPSAGAASPLSRKSASRAMGR